MALAPGQMPLAPGTSDAIAAARPSGHVTQIATRVLAGTMAAVYLVAAAMTPPGHPGVVVAQAAIGGAELLWLVALGVWSGRRGVCLAGAGLQLLLTVLWIVSRTAGMPGEGRLPVGELDLLCAADALVLGFLAWRCAARSLVPALSRRSLGLTQLAVILAASTVMLSFDTMMHMGSATAATVGANAAGGHVTLHFFCHLL